MENKGVPLNEVLNRYGVPDPRIVGKLPKGGIQLDFVGHADVTKMLIEIDPNWTWEPCGYGDDGLPAFRVENNMAHMAGWLTIHGIRRLGIGSVQHNKPDLFKELVSDFIRNAAMRFGVCLALWTKQEWDDTGGVPSAPPVPSPKPAAKQEKKLPTTPLTDAQIAQFRTACEKAGLDMEEVVVAAGIEDGPLVEADLAPLRAAFKELKEAK